MNQFEEIPEEMPVLQGNEAGRGITWWSMTERLRKDALMYLIIGGILLAFSIALGLYIYEVVLNWH